MRSLFFNRICSNHPGAALAAIWTATFPICHATGEELARPRLQLSGPAGTQAIPKAAIAQSGDADSEVAVFYEKYGGYCDAIVDGAREQRYALKRAEIETLSLELQKQIETAEAQSAALEKWVSKREEFARQATAKIVEIYGNMRPEASAARLQQLDVNLAASLLLAIPPRQASPILNEMDEKTAAAITAVMAASARKDDPS